MVCPAQHQFDGTSCVPFTPGSSQKYVVDPSTGIVQGLNVQMMHDDLLAGARLAFPMATDIVVTKMYPSTTVQVTGTMNGVANTLLYQAATVDEALAQFAPAWLSMPPGVIPDVRPQGWVSTMAPPPARHCLPGFVYAEQLRRCIPEQSTPLLAVPSASTPPSSTWPATPPLAPPVVMPALPPSPSGVGWTTWLLIGGAVILLYVLWNKPATVKPATV